MSYGNNHLEQNIDVLSLMSGAGIDGTGTGPLQNEVLFQVGVFSSASLVSGSYSDILYKSEVLSPDSKTTMMMLGCVALGVIVPVALKPLKRLSAAKYAQMLETYFKDLESFKADHSPATKDLFFGD